jgi:hypothetical protein
LGSASASPFELAAQCRQRLLIADVIGAVDVAVADAVLQRYTPGPAGIERAGARAGRDVLRIRVCAGQCDRPVADQPVAPVDEPALQCLVDEQAVKPAAVDVHRGLEDLTRVQAHTADSLRVVPAQHLEDAGVEAAHAARLREGAQEGGEPPGIEVHGPIEVLEVDARVVGRQGHAAGARELRAHRVFVENASLEVRLSQAIPEVVKRDGTGPRARSGRRDA